MNEMNAQDWMLIFGYFAIGFMLSTAYSIYVAKTKQNDATSIIMASILFLAWPVPLVFAIATAPFLAIEKLFEKKS